MNNIEFNEQQSLVWEKHGLLLQPNKDIDWISNGIGPSHYIKQTNGKSYLYITGRDSNNVSRIGRVEVLGIQDEKLIVSEISQNPLLDVGEIGCFDESGVSYPWIIEHESTIFMFYVGWLAGGISGFQNFSGLAISVDNGASFKRIQKNPILERTNMEPFGTGSLCVTKESNGMWSMLYTSFESWRKNENLEVIPSYNIKKAESVDLVNWKRKHEVAVDLQGDEEHVIGKPTIHDLNGKLLLFYSVRGKRYKIGYAIKNSNGTFVRLDKLQTLTTSDSGWDSEMVEYAQVFEFQSKTIMIYNGNGYGRTGLGYASLKIEAHQND